MAAEGDKSQAEFIARFIAGAQVVSNQVIPPGAESDANKGELGPAGRGGCVFSSKREARGERAAG